MRATCFRGSVGGSAARSTVKAAGRGLPLASYMTFTRGWAYWLG